MLNVWVCCPGISAQLTKARDPGGKSFIMGGGGGGGVGGGGGGGVISNMKFFDLLLQIRTF